MESETASSFEAMIPPGSDRHTPERVPAPSRDSNPEVDLHLIGRAREGDTGAIELLAHRLKVVARILTALNRRAGNPLRAHDLEDAAQDVALVVWRKLDGFRGVGSLESWLFRFCQLEFRSKLDRARRDRSQQASESETPLAEETASSPLDNEYVEDCLDELGDPESMIIRLKHFEGISFTEIGTRVGISPNTAKSRYYRGIRWLRRRLGNQGNLP